MYVTHWSWIFSVRGLTTWPSTLVMRELRLYEVSDNHDANAAYIFTPISIFAPDKLITHGFPSKSCDPVFCGIVSTFCQTLEYICSGSQSGLFPSYFPLQRNGAFRMHRLVISLKPDSEVKPLPHPTCSDCRSRLCTWDGKRLNRFPNASNSLFPCKCQSHSKTESEPRENGK